MDSVTNSEEASGLFELSGISLLAENISFLTFTFHLSYAGILFNQTEMRRTDSAQQQKTIEQFQRPLFTLEI